MTDKSQDQSQLDKQNGIQAGRLSNRVIIRLSPSDPAEDARAFLQGMLTQDMRKVQPGMPQWGGLLSPQGKLIHEFILWAAGETDILIDCAADARDGLLKKLKLYRLRRKIDIAADNSVSVHWAMEPPGASDASDASSADNIADAALDPRLPILGWRWLDDAGQGDTPDEAIDNDGADRQWRKHRLSLGVAEGQAEMGDGQILWLECNAIELNGVSFEKGCYVGQENTARMNWRSKVNRRLVVVPLDRANPKRQIAQLDDLSLSIEHRRIDDLADLELPKWLQNALDAASAQKSD